jgi:hypothetical protein
LLSTFVAVFAVLARCERPSSPRSTEKL